MSLTTDPNGALSFDLDSFPVASSARGLQRASLGLFLALYAVLLILAILRTTHSLGRRAVYLYFVLLALCESSRAERVLMLSGRIPTLALGLAVLQRQAAPLVMAMDIFSSLGYTFFTAGVFSLCYTWSIRLPSWYVTIPTSH
jgi:hypothetical protein